MMTSLTSKIRIRRFRSISSCPSIRGKLTEFVRLESVAVGAWNAVWSLLERKEGLLRRFPTLAGSIRLLVEDPFHLETV